MPSHKSKSPLKAHGPDRLSAGFYQHNWATVGDQVCQAILLTLNNGVINKDLNFTYIALIPKMKNPTCVSDFRLINLCNVMYKIISKMLAIRLKVVLLVIISQN